MVSEMREERSKITSISLGSDLTYRLAEFGIV